MSRVGIDLDGPLYNFVDACRNWFHEATDTPLEEMGEATEWNWWASDWGFGVQEGWDLILQGVEAGRIFAEGGVVHPGLQSLHELRAAGHSIHLVTARTAKEFGWRTEENTAEWLWRNRVPYDSLHFEPNKASIPCDYFIDDAVPNIASLRVAGVEAYLYDMGRKDQEGAPHKVDWPTFVSIIGVSK